MQRKRRTGRRTEKKAPPLTEFEQPKKRRPFTVFLVEDDQGVRASLVTAVLFCVCAASNHPPKVDVRFQNESGLTVLKPAK